MAVEKCGLTPVNFRLLQLHWHDKREPLWSREREKFRPFELMVSLEDLAATIRPSLRRAPRRPGAATLSPNLVIFHPFHRDQSRQVARAMDARSQDDPDAYGNIVATQEELLPSFYAHNWLMHNGAAIPAIAFRGGGTRERMAVMSRSLIWASDDIFNDLGLDAPMNQVPDSLLTLNELRGQ